MKLEVTLGKVKDTRGRITRHVAKLGHVEASGSTAKEAEENLAKLVTRMCSEDASPVLYREPSDGHVWMAYRTSWGDWWYTHMRWDDSSDLKPLHESGGCLSPDAKHSKALTVEAMLKDFASYPR